MVCEPCLWVDWGDAVWVDLEVEVGAGGESLAAHSCDFLACCDALADGDVEVCHVSVDGDGSVVVLDADPLSVAGCWAGADDSAGHDGVDWGAD